jgi:rhodanese-related sulfurtransferase
MTWASNLTKCCILLLVATFPAALQLADSGFYPPKHIPFGITASNAIDEGQRVLWVDARPEASFETGHIPGALNINSANWDRTIPDLFRVYQPGTTIIVYCSAGCSASEEIGDKIRKFGLEPTSILEGGFEAWQEYQHRL